MVEEYLALNCYWTMLRLKRVTLANISMTS